VANPRLENCMPFHKKCITNLCHRINRRLQFDERS
jgi:hypothetical protein